MLRGIIHAVWTFLGKTHLCLHPTSTKDPSHTVSHLILTVTLRSRMFPYLQFKQTGNVKLSLLH